MKVLFFSERCWPAIGGTEVLSFRLAAALVERGHQVQFLCDHHSKELAESEPHQGVQILRLPLKAPLLSRQPGLILRAQSQYRRALQSFQPDLVHVHFSGPSVYFPSHSPHPKTVTTVHDPLGYASSKLTNTLLGQSRRIVAVSDFVRQRLAQQYPELSTNLVCIPNAVREPDVAPLPPPSDPPFRLLALGRMVEDKGFDLLLQALEGLDGWQLDLIGEGPARQDLQALAERLQLANVHFRGALSDSQVQESLAQCQLLVVPSRWQECFGLVALEGMWHGRAVLAADAGALPEVVGEAGMLFAHLSVPALRAALQRFLHEPQLHREFGEAGYRRARESFRWEPFVEAHLSLYNEVLANA